jgi:hypothetical protein
LSAGCRPTEKFNNKRKKRVVKWYSILFINMSALSFQSIIYKYCSGIEVISISFIQYSNEKRINIQGLF